MLRRKLQSMAASAPIYLRQQYKSLPSSITQIPLVAASHRDQIPAATSRHRFRLELGEMEEGLVDMSFRASAASLISFKVDLNYVVNKQRVEQTLAKLVEIYPLLRCRVVLDEGGKYALEHNPSALVPIKVYEHADYTTVCDTELQRTQLQLGRNAHHVLILENTNSIVFNLEHFAFDGGSLVHFVDRFLQLYSGLVKMDNNAQDNEPWRIPACAAIRKTLNQGKLKTGYGMAREAIAMLPSNMFANTGRLARTKASQVYSDAEMPNLSQTKAFEHTLEECDVQRFKLACRANKGTITTAVAEAYARAFAERIEETQQISKPFSCSSVVVTDIRQMLEPKIPTSAMSPYVGASQFSSQERINWKQSFPKEERWKIARAMVQELKANANNAEQTLVRSLLNMQLTPYFPTSKMLPTFTISSWGAGTPIENQYGSVKVKDLKLFQNYNFFMAPSLSVYPCSNGKLRITMFATVPFHDEADLTWTSTRAKQILDEMITNKF